MYIQYQSRPYSRLNPSVQKALTSEDLAMKALLNWSPKAANLFALIDSKRFVSMDRVAKVCKESKASLYSRLRNNFEIFDRVGLSYVYDDDTTRLEVASQLGLHKYVRATSSIYLFTPRCLVVMLLSSRSPQGVSFRSSIQDWGPEKPYYLRKLHTTINV